MKTSASGLALIKIHEGLSLVPYRCPAGVWTIGYGHAMRSQEVAKYTNGISEAEAGALLLMDVALAEAALRRLVNVPLTVGQFDALVSFVFNLGAGRFQASTLRMKLNRGDYEAAAQEFPKWVWAGGRKLPGLIRRRHDEMAVFQGE
ncbi:MAG: lysozyme [Alphaproteobacteria bacterium]